MVRKPLEPAFKGPFEVERRHKKYFIIKRGKEIDKISIDRIKPAKMYVPDVPEMQKDNLRKPMYDETSKNVNPEPTPTVTRYGRRVKFPKFLLITQKLAGQYCSSFYLQLER